MDGLSAASGIAGLITLADVVLSRVYDTIIACKNAGRDARRLLEEVQALMGILKSVDTVERKLSSACLQTQIPATQTLSCQKTLQRLRDKLQKSDPSEVGLSIPKRVKRSVAWPLASSEMDEILQEMERHKSALNLAMSADAIDELLAASEQQVTTNEKVARIFCNVEDICRIEVDRERRRALDMVGAYKADETYRANLQICQPGTGLWFVEGSKFCSWLTMPNSKLWIYGIPGAGKTILSALAIQEILQLASSDYAVVFFYCDYKDEGTRHLTNTLSSVVGQLARQSEDCMAMLERRVKATESAIPRPGLHHASDSIQLLKQMLRLFKDVAIIVDGVDESHDSADVSEAFSTLAMDGTSIHTLLFSRKESDIECFLGEFQRLEIAAESQDLRLYVPAQIEERSRRRKLRIRDPAVKDLIIEKLVDGADGMFRWVTCQLDHLCNLTTDKERIEALAKLPPDLESTYDRILERVNAKSEATCTLVQHTIWWLLERRGEMRVGELCEALSITPGDTTFQVDKVPPLEEIMICCSSFLRVTTRGTIEFAHFTVEEYLRQINPNKKPHLTRYLWDGLSANSYKAEISLTYLNLAGFRASIFDDLTSTLEHLRRSQFYMHACRCWDYYSAYGSQTVRESAQISQLFLSPQHSNFANWRHIRLLAATNFPEYLFASRADQQDFIQPLSCFDKETADLDDEIKMFWVRSLAVASKTSEIHFAALLHLEEVIERLIANGCGVNESGVLGTPLHCTMLDDEILSYVMKCPIDKFPIRIARGQSRGQSRANLVELLLRLGADVHIDFPGTEHLFFVHATTTLSLASLAFVTKEILNAGAKFDAATARCIIRDLDDGYDLEVEYVKSIRLKDVAESDRASVAELLLRIDRDSERSTRSSLISSSSVKIETFDPILADSLRSACKRNDLEVFQWLFESANLDTSYRISDDIGSVSYLPLLHYASRAHSSRIVTFLVNQGADPNDNDDEGNPPLWHVLSFDVKLSREHSNSVLDTLNALLDAGADTTIHHFDGSGPLLWACTKGCIEATQLLLSKGCPYSYSSRSLKNTYSTLNKLVGPRQMAAYRDSVPLLKLLYEGSQDDNQSPPGAITPLFAACIGDSLNAVRFLLNQKEDREYSEPETGGRALHVAAAGGSLPIIKILMEAGCDANARDDKMLTPRMHAIKFGHGDAAKVLDQPTLGSQQPAPPRYSAQLVRDSRVIRPALPAVIGDMIAAGDTQDIKFLIQHGYEMDLPFERCGCTPMTAALAWNRPEIVTCLQDSGFRICGRVCVAHNLPYSLAFDLLAAQPSMLGCLYRALRENNFAEQDLHEMAHASAGSGNTDSLEALLEIAIHRSSLLSPTNVPTRDIIVGWTGQRWEATFPRLTTPLHTAVYAQQYSATELLLSHGSGVEAADINRLTSLHIAVRSSSLDIINLLLSHGANTNARTRYLQTPLMIAALAGRADSISRLLASDVDTETVDIGGKNALTLAAEAGHIAALKPLLEFGMVLSAYDLEVLYRRGWPSTLMYPARFNASTLGTDVFWGWILPLALKPILKRTPRSIRTRSLNERHSTESTTSLYVAACGGDLGVLEVLYQAGAMINLEGGPQGTALMGAAHVGRLCTVQYLARHGAVLDYQKASQRISAIALAQHFPKVVRWLLVGRFTDQLRLTAAEHQEGDAENSRKIAIEHTFAEEESASLDLVLSEDAQEYLERQSRVQDQRRYLDQGDNSFLEV